MAILSWKTARQRLRAATRDSLTMPAFGSTIDCTPWVIGGLWRQELSMTSDETAPLANHLSDDLQRIIRTANGKLTLIRHTQPSSPARHAQEGSVIDAARARAARRIESTIRHIKATTMAHTSPQRPPSNERYAGTDIGATQVIPVIPDAGPARNMTNPTAPPPEPHRGDNPHDTATVNPTATSPLADDGAEPEVSIGRHRAPDNDTPTGPPAQPCTGDRARHRAPDHPGAPARAGQRGPTRSTADRPDPRGPGHR